MTNQVKTKMREREKTFIKDIDELKEFVRMAKNREDYFDHIIDEVISNNQE